MTTISNEDSSGVQARVQARIQRTDSAGTRSRRFWAWTSAAWCTAVSITAVVAAGQAVTVAIGGMTVAAVCSALRDG